MAQRMKSKIDGLGRRIQKQLDELIALVPESETAAASVSNWSVGKHVEHLALATLRVLNSFEKALASPPEAVAGGPKMVGRLILWLGFIPRGKGKAPEQVIPQGVDRDEVRQRLLDAKELFDQLKDDLARLEGTGWRFAHPIFGPLSPLQWLRFMQIHNRHHQKVIRDIQRATT